MPSTTLFFRKIKQRRTYRMLPLRRNACRPNALPKLVKEPKRSVAVLRLASRSPSLRFVPGLSLHQEDCPIPLLLRQSQVHPRVRLKGLQPLQMVTWARTVQSRARRRQFRSWILRRVQSRAFLRQIEKQRGLPRPQPTTCQQTASRAYSQGFLHQHRRSTFACPLPSRFVFENCGPSSMRPLAISPIWPNEALCALPTRQKVRLRLK